jgi:Gas vesicle synthesis protein GvpL/GvpF
MTGEGPIYVYGVVSTTPSLTLPEDGVTNAATRVVESDGLAAVVSTVPGERLRVRRRDLDAHLHAVEQLFEQTTVLPCRFGTVLDSEEDVRRHLLEARRDELQGLLQGLDGRVQMNVKAEYDEPEVLREIVASNPSIARLRERAKGLGDAAYYENIRLGELITEQLSRRRGDDAERIYARLASLATDIVSDEDDAPALLVLKASFLVERKRLDRFDKELEALAKQDAPTMRYEAFGPLPPTAFVSLGREG